MPQRLIFSGSRSREERKLLRGLLSDRCCWKSIPFDSGNYQSVLSPRFLHGAVNINDEIHIFGGAASDGAGAYNDLWRFSDNTYNRIETQGNHFPTPRANFGIANTDKRIVISGGWFQKFRNHTTIYTESRGYRDIYTYDVDKALWQRVSITEGDGPSSMVIFRTTMLSDTEIVAFGGGLSVPGERVIMRGCDNLSILEFTSDYKSGTWHVPQWQSAARIPARFGHHQVYFIMIPLDFIVVTIYFRYESAKTNY